MRAANRCDRRSMARGGKPVVDGGANLAPLHRSFAKPVMSRDEQDDPITARNCLIETAVDREPGAVERQPMKVEHTIGLDRAVAQPFVPAPVEGPVGNRNRLGPRRRHRRAVWATSGCGAFRRNSSRPDRSDGLSRERTNRGGDPAPQLGFLRAERAHGRRRLSAPGSAPARSPTCRRRSRRPPAPNPRRCRTGSAP